MTLSLKERRKILKKANYLELHPVRKVNFEKDEDGKVRLLIPRFKNKLAKMLFKNKSEFIKIVLDEIGSEAWLNSSGNKNVEAIAQILETKFGENVKPADERLTRFYTALYNQKFISFKEIEKETEYER